MHTIHHRPFRAHRSHVIEVWTISERRAVVFAALANALLTHHYASPQKEGNHTHA